MKLLSILDEVTVAKNPDNIGFLEFTRQLKQNFAPERLDKKPSPMEQLFGSEQDKSLE